MSYFTVQTEIGDLYVPPSVTAVHGPLETPRMTLDSMWNLGTATGARVTGRDSGVTGAVTGGGAIGAAMVDGDFTGAAVIRVGGTTGAGVAAVAGDCAIGDTMVDGDLTGDIGIGVGGATGAGVAAVTGDGAIGDTTADGDITGAAVTGVGGATGTDDGDVTGGAVARAGGTTGAGVETGAIGEPDVTLGVNIHAAFATLHVSTVVVSLSLQSASVLQFIAGKKAATCTLCNVSNLALSLVVVPTGFPL